MWAMWAMRMSMLFSDFDANAHRWGQRRHRHNKKQNEHDFVYPLKRCNALSLVNKTFARTTAHIRRSSVWLSILFILFFVGFSVHSLRIAQVIYGGRLKTVIMLRDFMQTLLTQRTMDCDKSDVLCLGWISRYLRRHSASKRLLQVHRARASSDARNS